MEYYLCLILPLHFPVLLRITFHINHQHSNFPSLFWGNTKKTLKLFSLQAEVMVCCSREGEEFSDCGTVRIIFKYGVKIHWSCRQRNNSVCVCMCVYVHTHVCACMHT